MKTLWLAITCLIASTLPGAEPPPPIYKLDADELAARLEGDVRSVRVERDGLREVVQYVESRPDLFPESRPAESGLMPREQKEIVWNTWQRFLDYLVALESMEKYHTKFTRLKGASKEDSFLIGYTSMLARYRAALEFIDRAEQNPELHKILNEPVPELGLPGGTYAKLKFQYLNVAIATDFAARQVVMKTFSGTRRPELSAAIKEDRDTIWKTGRGRGELLTAKNALKIVQSGAESAWLPVQSGVSEWMGDTKVYRSGTSLISPAQVTELQTKLRPGDFLLERREWYVSNVGLPGFWSHAALYIGTAEERRGFFSDTAVQAWVKEQGEASGDLEALLKARCGEAYALSQEPQHEHVVRVIEAISEGVSFTTLEHSADCDSLAALRPRLSKVERAQAILRAFHYSGRPYDFSFDFATDSELVCTELVYKAYEPAAGLIGLKFPLVEMLGRKVTPANEIAKQFDAQFGKSEQQSDLLIFLDGHERTRRAIEASVDAFCLSWKRPKWHVLAQ